MALDVALRCVVQTHVIRRNGLILPSCYKSNSNGFKNQDTGLGYIVKKTNLNIIYYL